MRIIARTELHEHSRLGKPTAETYRLLHRQMSSIQFSNTRSGPAGPHILPSGTYVSDSWSDFKSACDAIVRVAEATGFDSSILVAPVTDLTFEYNLKLAVPIHAVPAPIPTVLIPQAVWSSGNKPGALQMVPKVSDYFATPTPGQPLSGGAAKTMVNELIPAATVLAAIAREQPRLPALNVPAVGQDAARRNSSV
jgi:hypothetical protein